MRKAISAQLEVLSSNWNVAQIFKAQTTQYQREDIIAFSKLALDTGSNKFVLKPVEKVVELINC